MHAGPTRPLPNENPQQGTVGGTSSATMNRNTTTTAATTSTSTSSSATNQTSATTNQHYYSRGSKIPPTHKDARKLFVGGLPSNVTEDEFRIFFEQFGVVLDSIVMIDRDTRRSRGFGFVTFEDSTVASQLLNSRVPDMDHVEGVGRVYMRSKLCEIKAAEPREPGVGYNFQNRKNRHHRNQNNNKNNTRWSSPDSSVNPGVPSSLTPYDTPMMYPPPPPTNMYYPHHHGVLYGDAAAFAAPYPPYPYETEAVTANYGAMMEGYAIQGMIPPTQSHVMIDQGGFVQMPQTAPMMMLDGSVPPTSATTDQAASQLTNGTAEESGDVQQQT